MYWVAVVRLVWQEVGKERLWRPGYSDITFDVNGHASSAVDRVGNRNIQYVTDAQGTILVRDEITGSIERPNYRYNSAAFNPGSVANKVTRYYYVDGKRVGDVSNDGASPTDYVQSMAARGAKSGNYANWQPVSSADFDQNYQPITPTNPGATASTYTVRQGDTLQSIAQTVWGDSAMWYLIADANGLTSNDALAAGVNLIIPNKVTNVHNNSGTFKPYNPGEAMGDTSPTLPVAPSPPKKKGGGCGGLGAIIVAVVSVAVTVMSYGTLGPVGAAALGNLAGQVTGNLVGVQKGFDFRSFATSVISAGVTQGVMGSPTNPTSIASKLGEAVGGGYAAIAARAVANNVINQGVGNLTGSQKGFSWTSVAVAGVGAAAGAYATDKLKLTTDYGMTPTSTGFGADLGQAATSAGAYALTQLVVRGGKVNWQQVATDTITNLIQNRAQSRMIDLQSTAIKNNAPLGSISITQEQREAIGAQWDEQYDVMSSHRNSSPDDDLIKASQSSQFADFKLYDGVYRPGINDAQRISVAEIGGHFALPQLIGQSFVGAYSPVLSREFSQQDLNMIVAYSQLPDQVQYFDALAAGMRYANPLSGNWLDSDMRVVQESLHSLNSHGIQFNIDRSLDVVMENPGNWAIAGMVLHPLVDAVPHAGYAGILGHLEPSLKGHSPDYMSPELAVATAPSVLHFFETITGVSGDEILAPEVESIKTRSFSRLGQALSLASADNATGVKFERQFYQAVQQLLPDDALRLPTLPAVSAQWAFKQSWEGAVEQTSAYLGQIRLNQSPYTFLSEAFDAYVVIANQYLAHPKVNGTLYDGSHVQPIDRNQVLPTPMPRTDGPTFLHL